MHGHQEGRFFHNYYENYCYLPRYIFCGRHLLAAKLRRADIDGSARAVGEVERLVARILSRWPKVRIILRADSGFARDKFMTWCEDHQVDYLFDLAKAERWEARALYERLYCARGEMENRIKECQVDLFTDRTCTATIKASPLRFWFASFAYVLLESLRRLALGDTALAPATCGSLRMKLLKLGALVKIAFASSCPYQAAWALAYARLNSPPSWRFRRQQFWRNSQPG